MCEAGGKSISSVFSDVLIATKSPNFQSCAEGSRRASPHCWLVSVPVCSSKSHVCAFPNCPSIWVLVQPRGHFTPQQRDPGTAPQESNSNPGCHQLLLPWAACANKHLLPTYAPQAASIVWDKVEGIIKGETGEHRASNQRMLNFLGHAEVQHMPCNLGQVTYLLSSSVPSNVGEL